MTSVRIARGVNLLPSDIDNALYFLSESAHKHLINIDNPSKRVIEQLSEVVIDIELLEIIKCRKRIEDVVVFGLENF